MITMDEELFLDSYLGMIMELIEEQKDEAKKMKFVEGFAPVEDGDIVLSEVTLFERAIMLAYLKETEGPHKFQNNDQVEIAASKGRAEVLKNLYQKSIDSRLKENVFLGKVFVRTDLKLVHKTEKTDAEQLIDYSIFQTREE